MKGLKSLFFRSIIAGALALPLSQQVKAQQNPPSAHHSIEEIVEYDPNRGCDVGLIHSQSRGNRPQGVRLSDDDVMTQTIGLQGKYFQLFTFENRIDGSGQDSKSYMVQISPLIRIEGEKFVRFFIGFGGTNYSESKQGTGLVNFGFQFKVPKALDIKAVANFNHTSDYPNRDGNSDYFTLTAGHDFKMGDELQIPVTVGVERYCITNEGHRERQNEIFFDVGLK